MQLFGKFGRYSSAQVPRVGRLSFGRPTAIALTAPGLTRVIILAERFKLGKGRHIMDKQSTLSSGAAVATVVKGCPKEIGVSFQKLLHVSGIPHVGSVGIFDGEIHLMIYALCKIGPNKL